MGRAFEYRKATKMKRWANMATVFTKIGREIALACKEGVADPENNPRLRVAMLSARKANMPKANVDAAIKRATSKDADDFTQVVYEGYGPHGVAFVIETTTNNPTRTVANVRLYFNRNNGSLGTSGSVDYMFDRKGLFRIKAEGQNIEDLEFELIDFGLDEMKIEDDEIFIYTVFEEFGSMQKALEERNIDIEGAELIRIPTVTKKLDDAQTEDLIKLIDKFEEDEDVANLFHTMDMSE
jgi:YebC/PmpR family DNA-binding regulatory protein